MFPFTYNWCESVKYIDEIYIKFHGVILTEDFGPFVKEECIGSLKWWPLLGKMARYNWWKQEIIGEPFEVKLVLK